MLDIAKVDLGLIAEALEDHSWSRSWWLDPTTGDVNPGASEMWDGIAEAEEDYRAAEDRGLVAIEPIDSSEAYGDMEDFIEAVSDPRARSALERAIRGRGAFRRFKDTLLDHPELRDAWFRFHDVRMERRALTWLTDAGLVEPGVASAEIAKRPDPDVPHDAATGLARAVAVELRTLFADELDEVIVFGSRARDDAGLGSDLDLLVVLDRVDSPWEDLRRMDDILWRHSLESGVTISAVPVSSEELRSATWPLLERVRAEGRRVA